MSPIGDTNWCRLSPMGDVRYRSVTRCEPTAVRGGGLVDLFAARWRSGETDTELTQRPTMTGRQMRHFRSIRDMNLPKSQVVIVTVSSNASNCKCFVDKAYGINRRDTGRRECRVIVGLRMPPWRVECRK